MKFENWKRGLGRILLISPFGLLMVLGFGYSGTKDEVKKPEIKSKFYYQNERCFRCHNEEKFSYQNTTTNKEVTDLMCSNRKVKRDEFYVSNHRSFACLDCHAAEYDTFPHPSEARMEERYNCLDCHGYDEQYAKYHFEEIDAEFQKSVHYTANAESFTCWKCHNPHSYKITVRSSENVMQSIAYDNHICLNCHSDFDNFQLLTDKKEINLIQKHEWLPNQALHFSQVRCIECHARPNDSLLVSHMVLPKKNAVKRCVQCHSQNSLLMGSLYKYQAKENRNTAGFLNAIILNNAFVIGANRNVFLNEISVVVFLLALMAVIGHLTLRVLYQKKHH
jgi:hypothetical protein